MEASFWHDKWERQEIGFHQGKPNPHLVKHFDSLELAQNARVFLPLCGKTRDISWFLGQGCKVAGAELNESAVKQLFEELDLEPKVAELGALKHYRAQDIDIFVGDIFELEPSVLGEVDAIYDRAALVALPSATRVKYTAHLRKLCPTASQLSITFCYDQEQMAGPPFSISSEEFESHYAAHYKIDELETRPVEGKLKGQVEALAAIRLLRPSSR